ncbi:MAG: hypothetical protein ISP90_00195 [Nevskia sp.]|nr:hypothetical protein [Nevskia sp.]
MTRNSSQTASEDILALPMVQALLHELLDKLGALQRDGRSDSVDLRRLPLPPGALDALRAWLGAGEIRATVKALGVTTVEETAITGLWWVSQAKLTGEPTGAWIEVSLCPALLMAHAEDLGAAIERLRGRLPDPGTGSRPDPSADAR